MGTCKSFYNIYAGNLTDEQIQIGFSSIREAVLQANNKKINMMKNLYFSTEFLEGLVRILNNFESTLAIAKNESLKWFPFFETYFHEQVASSREAQVISEAFQAPVITFSIFDSDILFVSYTDSINGISLDYASPNSEGYEEYDQDLYSRDFPQFLLEYSDASVHQKLLDIWRSYDYIFADEKMKDICRIMNMYVLYDAYEHDLPEEFILIHPQETAVTPVAESSRRRLSNPPHLRLKRI